MKGLNQKTGINPLINQVIASALGNTCAELENPCELISIFASSMMNFEANFTQIRHMWTSS